MTGYDAHENLKEGLKLAIEQDRDAVVINIRAAAILLKHFLKRQGFVNCGSIGIKPNNCGCYDCKMRREY